MSSTTWGAKPDDGGVKPTLSRTIGPLHFEDLDPHRFEDHLVRHLAYHFRSWEALEAIGRSGDDGGVDIRGIEAQAQPCGVRLPLMSDYQLGIRLENGEELTRQVSGPGGQMRVAVGSAQRRSSV